MSPPAKGTGVERLARFLVGLAAPLVPRVRREAWREEWESEIWHYRNQDGAAGPERSGGAAALLFRCLGAVPHGLWIRGEEWNLDSLWQDVRFAVRTLTKRPGFTVVAGLTLALGIGANTAVFSVVNGVVLRPLPIPDADDLVFVWGRMYQGTPAAAVSPPDFLDYREGTKDAFADFAAYAAFVGTAIYGEEGAQRQELRTRGMTVNLPHLLGWEPALGRGFTDAEGAGASSDAVLLSHGAWQRAFGGDREVVGRTIRLNGAPRTVIGVLPEAWAFQPIVDVWLPVQFGTEGFSSRSAHFLRPLGRLAPGVTMADAQASLDRVSARLEAAYPDTNEGWYALLQPLQQFTVGDTGTALLMIMGAVALVLLVACGNVASLFLARAAGRRGEVALRSALGAPRGRVVRQLLVESVLLSLGAGAVGVGMALLGVRALKGMAPGYIPRLEEVGVDGTVLAVTFIAAVLAGVVFGLVPALELTGKGVGSALGHTGGGRSAHRSAKTRRVLVVGEVALSFVLIVGATLAARSFVTLSSVDPGFDDRGVLALSLTFPDGDYAGEGEVLTALDAIKAEVEALPEVAVEGFTTILPLSGSGGDTYVWAEGRPPEQRLNIQNTADIRVASPDYFAAMSIPLVQGRLFERSDDGDGAGVVVVNETLARWLFPDEDPVGRRLMVSLDTVRAMEIVGVVGDVRQYTLGEPARPGFYLAVSQGAPRSLNLVVKGARGLPAANTVREAVRRADPRQPLTRALVVKEMVDGTLSSGRLQALLMGLFALLAMILAAVGLYGVLAQTVADRRTEIGVRLAMGADPREVVRMVVRQGTGMAVVGVAVGAVLALGLARVLTSTLYGVAPWDPVAFVATPVILAGVAALASWVPARRAARTDPVEAMRAQ